MEHLSYNLVSLIQKKNYSVRALAKELNINHMSVSRYCKKLFDDNILDFRLEGRNKIYSLKNSLESLEFIKMLEHYKLIKLLHQYSRLRKIVRFIRSKNISLALFFGSYVTGNFSKNSDIDIYIDSLNYSLKRDLELLDSKLSVKLGKFDKNNLLIREIIKNHVIVIGVDEFYDKVYQKFSFEENNKIGRT